MINFVFLTFLPSFYFFSIGHAAITLRLLRVEAAPLSPEKTFDLCHHLLKSKLLRKGGNEHGGFESQVLCLINSGINVSAALTTTENILRPNLKVDLIKRKSAGRGEGKTQV